MQINLATITQHATEKLRRIESQPGRAERIGSLKKFLKIETQRLHLRHRFGIGGHEIAAARSLIVDLLIRQLAEVVKHEQAGEAQLAIIALGGYGRGELAPHSDIDLMFLHQGRRTAESAGRLSEAILYLLWDVGFSVGHSVRSLSECVAIAKEDIVSRNALIEARLLWGDEEVFEQLKERLDEEVFEKQKRALLDELLSERDTRYEKFGATPCLQEPNVKESAGGLRDLHSFIWAARIAYSTADLKRLVAQGTLPERDAKAINAAYDFLLRVRNELHFMTGRRTDLLSLDLQQQAARDFGYADTPEQQASEMFMRDYYLHARRLRRLCAAHLQRAVATQEKKSWLGRLRSAPAIGGFLMRDGALSLDAAKADSSAQSPDAARLDGAKMMLAFGYAQATGASFSPELQEAIESSLPAVNRAFRSSPEANQAFLKMLRARGRVAAGLRQMHELDFLGKLLPEFGRVTCLVQHDLYHRFTVDEHTLRTVEVLDELHNSRDPRLERYRKIYDALPDPMILHLGLLMHDIGKGLGGGHTEKGVKIAERVCARLGLSERESEQIRFLVAQHLTLSHIAQRRDLSDEKVIGDFAAQVGSLERLNLLTLLTYADINGVGPGVWNEWKDSLVWELYTKASAELAAASQPVTTAEPEQETLSQRIARMLASEIELDEVRAHFAALPESYGRATPPQTIIEHLRLVHGLNSRLIKTSWRTNTQTRCTDLHLCARNRRGLLATVAGTLTAQSVNILSVQLNTRADGVAIDSFKVRDTAGEPISDPARWEQIDQALKRALAGELDVASAVDKRLKAQNGSRLGRRKALTAKPTQITWDNYSSDKSTILEVRTSDRMGLVYRIASVLSTLGLDIVFAKVATEKNQALDVFYVTGAAGEKVEGEDDLLQIKDEILRALGEPLASAQ